MTVDRVAVLEAELVVSREAALTLRQALERKLRLTYNPSCECGHGQRDHRFAMDGGTGWCKSHYCKCDKWNPPPFDLEAEMAAVLVVSPVVPSVTLTTTQGGEA